jgi:hypothetical protein
MPRAGSWSHGRGAGQPARLGRRPGERALRHARSVLAGQVSQSEAQSQPLILAPDHPLAQQAFAQQDAPASPGSGPARPARGTFDEVILMARPVRGADHNIGYDSREIHVRKPVVPYAD